MFNRPRIGANILGLTFLLFITPILYLWIDDYIESSDERAEKVMKLRTSIEQQSSARISCSGNSIYYRETRWVTSVILLKPVEDEIKPVFLAIFNIHESAKSCDISKYPDNIGAAVKVLEQCDESAQREMQAMLDRFDELECPFYKVTRDEK